MNKVFYPVIFHPEDVGFSTSVPDIDGCFSQGDTMNEAVAMTQDAIGLMLEDYDASQAFPDPSQPGTFHLEDGDFVTMVEFDPIDYRKRHESQAVKKTLTIPGWLNHLAEEQGLNFSRILQNALKQELGVS